MNNMAMNQFRVNPMYMNIINLFYFKVNYNKKDIK